MTDFTKYEGKVMLTYSQFAAIIKVYHIADDYVKMILIRQRDNGLYGFACARYNLDDKQVQARIKDYSEDMATLGTPHLCESSLATIVKLYGSKIFERILEIEELPYDRHFESTLTNFLRDRGHNFSLAWDEVLLRLQLFQPEVVSEKTVSVYRNGEDYVRGRRTEMKVGKSFRLMFPEEADHVIEHNVDEYRHVMTPREFTLHAGSDRRSFAKAFGSARCSYQNPRTTSKRKSIACSCMQQMSKFDKPGSEVVFAEAYASGDFSVAWLETKEGRVGGRVVYSNKNFAYAPIYGACEAGMDMLQDHLNSLVDADVNELFNDEHAWEGHKLLIIHDEYGDPIVPYLDIDIEGSYSFGSGGEYILLELGGDHELKSTDGYMTDSISCECCGEGIHEDDVCTSPSGERICEHCFDSNYIYTENGDAIDNEDAVCAYSIYQDGNAYDSWQHIDDTYFIEALDEYWLAEACTYVEELDDYYPTHLLDDLELEGEEDEAA